MRMSNKNIWADLSRKAIKPKRPCEAIEGPPKSSSERLLGSIVSSLTWPKFHLDEVKKIFI